jgi:hypothetical protein
MRRAFEEPIMKNSFRVFSAALPLLAALAFAPAAVADERDHHDRDRHEHEWREHERHEQRDFHGREFHRFSAVEVELWRGGQWRHDWHDGRFGWWWEADGFWYWYPEPVYPYPTYVPPAVVVETPPPPPPAPPPAPVVVVQPPPPPSGQPPAQSWYYCDASQAYYPYVQDCAGPWRAVPATATR